MIQASWSCFEVIHAGNRLRFRFGFAQRWQQHGSQNRDDGDDHQQFDQGEATLKFRFVSIIVLFVTEFSIKFWRPHRFHGKQPPKNGSLACSRRRNEADFSGISECFVRHLTWAATSLTGG